MQEILWGSMAFEFEIQTRYTDTAQDGIIHHSSFIIYLEEARLAFFKSFGFDINEMESKKILTPVTELSIKYLKPLRSLENITVRVSVGAFAMVRFSLDYEIIREEAIVARATVSHCFINESFKPIPIPKAILQYFESSQV